MNVNDVFLQITWLHAFQGFLITSWCLGIIVFDLFSLLCDCCSNSGGNQGEQSVMELKTKLRPHFLLPELFTFILPKKILTTTCSQQISIVILKYHVLYLISKGIMIV